MDRFYVIGAGYTDEPAFFKLLAKYFPDTTTFYVEGPSSFGEGLSIPRDIAACYCKHMEKGERLPHKGDMQIYSLSFSQDLMEELAVLSEKHNTGEYLISIDLCKESDSLLTWHDAFSHGSTIEISGLVPEEVVSEFASELGWKYRVIIENNHVGHWSDPHKDCKSMCESKKSDLLQRIQAWKQGSYYCLAEDLRMMGPDIIPELIEFFRVEEVNDARAFLVEVIYQFRQREVIPLLAEALYDESPLVWQTALDGLITLDLPECIQVIEQARTRPFKKEKDLKYFQKYLDEAIQMLREGVWGEKKEAKSLPDSNETD